MNSSVSDDALTILDSQAGSDVTRGRWSLLFITVHESVRKCLIEFQNK